MLQHLVTEAASPYADLPAMTTLELVSAMNAEDRKVAEAVSEALPQIARLTEAVAQKMLAGGRLFYIGAGTSGRLGVVDASEIPPTYGLPFGRVVGIMAGGIEALYRSIEPAEDDPEQAWRDLSAHEFSQADIVVGIAASGRTPYVVGGLRQARARGIVTGSITCNRQTELHPFSDYPVEVVTGPEFVTGSTRLKAGTAQKMVLNMISTVAMIRLGRVSGNRMVDMELSNSKLLERGVHMICQLTGADPATAQAMLDEAGSVREAVRRIREQAPG